MNEILEKYDAKNGKNVLKEEIKGKFASENWEVFRKRPICEDFLEYAAKDVEDLRDVMEKMVGKMIRILKDLGVVVEKEGVMGFLRRVGRKYVKEGCDL